MLMGEPGSAPEATASVDGVLFLHVAVPALVLSTMGQIAVVSMLNVPRLLCDRNVDGGLTLLTVVEVQPGPLNQTSSAVASIWALSILFMSVAVAPLRMLRTYDARSAHVAVGAFANGPWPVPSPL